MIFVEVYDGLMHIAMAGSSGYLGTALRERLVHAGHDITRLVRHTPRAKDEVEWNPYREDLDPAVLDGVQTVINLSGVPIAGKRWNTAYKKRIVSSRVIPTRVLAKAVAEAKTPTFLSASAVGFYGARGELTVDESNPPAGDFLGETARKWEEATEEASEAGSRVVNLRTSHVFGPGAIMLNKLGPAFKFGLGGHFGNGQQYLPWISLRDWTKAVEFVMNGSISGPVNLVSPTPTRNKEFAKALGRQMNRPAMWPIPGFAVKIIAGEAAVELLRGSRIVPGVLHEHDFDFFDPIIDDALDYALSD